jgi:MoaA/NifB/PqqE/SkfB family radical SAM enzyme
MHLNIFVSKKCFLYCKGCYSFSRADSCQNITETDTIVDFLKYARSEGASTVTLCGGDPLMRPDILNLLKKVN